MNSATFLLVINFFIGLSFATAFLALTWKARMALGAWCAAGFVAASTTVTVEALAGVLPSVRLTSTLSYASLMVALTSITIGLVTHYRPQARIAPLVAFGVAAILFNAFVVFDWPRGGWPQALGYQAPFAAVLAFAAYATAAWSPRRGPDLALVGVLAVSALQFLAKAALAAISHAGAGVRDYIFSSYAFYSQTASGVLSLLLGLALLGVIVREVMEASARRFALDSLSGVLNRSAFLDRVAAGWMAATARRGALVVADLDRFKSINDRFGHAAGDEVIRQFGATLRALFSEPALCGRLGGEEFCLLLPEGDEETARARIGALQAALRELAYTQLPADVKVTASFGIARLYQGEPFDAALHRADMALYEAKAAGRDRCHFVADGVAPTSGRPPFRVPAQPG